MPRTLELLPAGAGPWAPRPPAVTVVEDASPEALAEFQRLANTQEKPMNVQQDLLGRIGAVIQDHIEPIFKAGTRFTVIARTPGKPEADVLVSNDTLEELAALIERSKGRDDIQPVGVPR